MYLWMDGHQADLYILLNWDKKENSKRKEYVPSWEENSFLQELLTLTKEANTQWLALAHIRQS